MVGYKCVAHIVGGRPGSATALQLADLRDFFANLMAEIENDTDHRHLLVCQPSQGMENFDLFFAKVKPTVYNFANFMDAVMTNKVKDDFDTSEQKVYIV